MLRLHKSTSSSVTDNSEKASEISPMHLKETLLVGFDCSEQDKPLCDSSKTPSNNLIGENLAEGVVGSVFSPWLVV